jgi:genome maintenance exonuclease 1
MAMTLNTGLTTSTPTKFTHLGYGLGKRRYRKIEQYTAPDGKRVYNTPDGNRYPSITTMLGWHGRQKIQEWRNRVGAETANTIARVAAGRGTGLHLAAENYLNNQAPAITNPLVLEMWGKFRPYLDRINNIHIQEVGLFSNHLRLAGTVDCIAEWDGRLSIIDFKTSTKPKEKHWIDNYFMQCAAYAIMYEELTFIPVPRIVVLIAVEEDSTVQVFEERRDNWTAKLLQYRDIYETATSALTTTPI